MKQLSGLIIAIFTAIILSACGVQPPTPAQPPISAGSLDSAVAYLSRGDQYFAITDYANAILDYTQAIRLTPDYAEAYNNRGFAYALSGKLEMAKAIADYSQAIQLRPAYAYAYNNRGVAYMASGYPDEALRDFNRAILLQPNFPQAHSNRGNAYNRLGRLDLAIPDFLQAWLIQPGWIAVLCGIPLLITMLGAWAIFRGVKQKRGLTPSSR